MNNFQKMVFAVNLHKTNKTLISITMIGLINCFPFPAFADDFLSSQMLLATCNSEPGSRASAYCGGYITGTFELMELEGFQQSDYGDGTKPMPQLSVCPRGKETTSPEVTRQIVMQWAKKHPAKPGEDALLLVMGALQNKWPCPGYFAPTQ